MKSVDIDAARANVGLAPVSLTERMGPGAVFVVDVVLRDRNDRDAVVRFPEAELQARPANHSTRRVIVVQAKPLCAKGSISSILVVPCSSTHKGEIKPWHYEVPPDEDGFTKDRIVAYPALVQPVLKRRLISYEGSISADALGEIQGRVRMFLGFDCAVGSGAPVTLGLPPRAP